MGRYILHCDLNNFYASVESLFDVTVRNSPLVVVGDVEKRHGIVLAKNALAKERGVKTGDTVWEAHRKFFGSFVKHVDDADNSEDAESNINNVKSCPAERINPPQS